jgi:predicted AAA+ superfamily ATPase
MCLISAKIEENEDGEERKIILKSEQKVFEQIKKIDLPMVVVAVVGPCRTGNSYLMNCLASSFKGTHITIFVFEVVMCSMLIEQTAFIFLNKTYKVSINFLLISFFIRKT